MDLDPAAEEGEIAEALNSPLKSSSDYGAGARRDQSQELLCMSGGVHPGRLLCVCSPHAVDHHLFATCTNPACAIRGHK